MSNLCQVSKKIKVFLLFFVVKKGNGKVLENNIGERVERGAITGRNSYYGFGFLI